MSETAEPLRPHDLAVLLLAGGDMLPRQRARDQQADRAGLDLKRRLLTEVIALDPEAADLEEALVQIVEDLGPPSGPIRSLARAFLEEWQAAVATPEWVTHLLGEALQAPRGEGRRRGTQLPG
jgi:hypothetical protein